MIYIIYFSLTYLTITSAILIRNLFEFKGLKDVKINEMENFPFVSICIPARNEESVIERCVTSALKQDYESFEVLVLDDNSTDKTTSILKQLSGIIHNLEYLKGAPKPPDWLGKPWACHQLSQKANGDVIVFIDADVWLEPSTLIKTVELLKNRDAITVWPQQRLESFWENIIIPAIYFSLYTLLPAKYVEQAPKWLPRYLKTKFFPKFVAGCGQFFAFRKSTYLAINGHISVKNKVVEDMELARNLKNNSLSLSMLHGLDSVYCRMYTNHSEIWNGFKKNFLAGFGNLFEFILSGVIHFLVFIFPIIALFNGLALQNMVIITFSTVSILLVFIQRIILSLTFRWPIWFSFFHPLAVLWFQMLGVICIVNKVFGIKNTWKEREV